MMYKVLVGEHAGKVFELDTAKRIADAYIDDYFYMDVISFDSKGNYKNFSTGQLMLKQLRPKKKQGRIIGLKVDKGYIKRLRAKVKEKDKSNLVV